MQHGTTTAKPLTEPQWAAFRRALAAAGWRFTRQRAAVFEFLRSTKDHATAEQVYEGVRRRIPNISLATVYKAVGIDPGTQHQSNTGRPIPVVDTGTEPLTDLVG